MFASVLYVGAAAYELRRVGPRTLDMHVRRGWLNTPLERLMRDVDTEPFGVGQVVQLPALTARILAVDTSGAPTAVRFEFVAALNDPGWSWLRFDGRRVVRWTPPQIGAMQAMPGAAVAF